MKKIILEIILEKLKAKFEGVSDSILDRIAEKLAKTVKNEEEATTAVEGVTLQQLFDSYGDSRATEAQRTAVSNYEKKYGLKDGAKVTSGGAPDSSEDETGNEGDKNSGSVQVMDGTDRKASDYRALQSIGRSFAESGSTVQITKAVHYKDELYKDVFGGLKGTKYERKCPDLIVDGRYYEYEGYTGQWSKRKLKNMLSHGLKQSDRIIINNNKGGNDRLIRKMIQARLHINADIKEIWLYEKGKLRLFYSE